MRGFFVLGIVLGVAGCGRTDLAFSSFDDGDGDAAATWGSTGATESDSSPPPPPSTTGPPPTTTTGPPPVECEIDAQCLAPDPCLQGWCDFGACVFDLRDADDDGHPPLGCGGDDCNDLNPNTFPGAGESCFDGDDNDCNGVADCFDPACFGVPDCGCTPSPGGEVCTNGVDDDCDTTVDCNDVDCIGTPSCGCAGSEAGLCVNGFDDDCDDAIDCDDNECAADPTCQCMNTFEECSNGFDDDCDLLVDCADPDCEGIFPCTCAGQPVPEVCDDGQDNDCDDTVDCADPDCFVSMACQSCMPETCNDGQDNDCDGLVDCADDACAFDPGCAPVAEVCNNDLDDDHDGLVDCDDPDCANAPVCAQSHGNCQTAMLIPGTGTYLGDTTGHTNNTEGSCGGGAGEAVFRFVLDEPSHVIIDSIGTSFDSVLYVRAGSCTAGAEVGCDDDSAGSAWAARLDFTLLYPGSYFIFLDGYTIDPFGGPNEGPYQLNVEIIENPPEICDDLIDNDGDVYADCGDPDCTFVPPCAGCLNGGSPSAEFGTARCTDGLDNDCDGTVDCDDDDCSASDYYVTECCNGTDQNDNGIPDDFNCRCNNDAECDGGQICYTHTANTCGFPCDAFFGDVCPFVAPGAACNLATTQCEF